MVQILCNSVSLVISYDQAEFRINYINQRPIVNMGVYRPCDEELV